MNELSEQNPNPSSESDFVSQSEPNPELFDHFERGSDAPYVENRGLHVYWKAASFSYHAPYKLPHHLDESKIHDNGDSFSEAHMHACQTAQLPLKLQNDVKEYLAASDLKQQSESTAVTVKATGASANAIATLEMSNRYKEFHALFPDTIKFPPPPELLLPGAPQRHEAEEAPDSGDSLTGNQLCEVCKLIDFRSFFTRENPPRMWHVQPKADLVSRFDECQWCRFLYRAALQLGIPLNTDGGYLPHYLASDQVFERRPLPFNSRCCIKYVGDGGVPVIEARQVVDDYSSSAPLKARLISPHVIDLSLVRCWLHDCETLHSNLCGVRLWETGSVLPTSFRVVDVRERKIVAAPTGCRYVTLSYVWGVHNMFRITSATLAAMSKAGGLNQYYDSMPRSVTDAIRLVEGLGETYLWVDSICILQDDPKDKAEQIHKMDAIYSNSILTVIAAGGENANVGLPGVWPHLRLVDQIVEETEPGIRIAVPLEPSRSLEDSVWNTRAWTFQERLLSARCLIFIDDQVFWQCGEKSWCEDVIAEPEIIPKNTFLNPTSRRRRRDEELRLHSFDINSIFKDSSSTPADLKKPPVDWSIYSRTGAQYQPPFNGDEQIQEEMQNEMNTPVTYTFGTGFTAFDAFEGYQPFLPDPVKLDVMYDINEVNPITLLSWNFKEYAKVVAEYTKRDITYQSDILNAFSGLRDVFERTFGAKLLYGLPTSHFDAALLWMPAAPSMRRTWIDGSSGTERSFPSWSWAGWCQSAKYVTPKDYGPFARHKSYEIVVRPLVRWYVQDDSVSHSPFQLLNENGIGMITTCHPPGILPSQWTEEKWNKDKLYALDSSVSIPDLHLSEQDIQHNSPVNQGHGLLKFRATSSLFHLGTELHIVPQEERLYPLWDEDLEEWIPQGDYEDDRVSIKSLRSSAHRFNIINASANNVGHVVMNTEITEEVAHKQAHEFIVVAETESPRSFGPHYACYNVMLVEWMDGVAFRVGLGEIHKDAWWEAEPSWKVITLG